MGMDVTPYPSPPDTQVSMDIHGFMIYVHSDSAKKVQQHVIKNNKTSATFQGGSRGGCLSC
jgi:hypothetical protein